MTTARSDEFFGNELDALMYSVRYGDPMNVTFADGYWVTPKSVKPDGRS